MIVNTFISSSPTVISCNLTTDCESVSVYIAVPLPADINPNFALIHYYVYNKLIVVTSYYIATSLSTFVNCRSDEGLMMV